jgi:hypothetical protein
MILKSTQNEDINGIFGQYTHRCNLAIKSGGRGKANSKMDFKNFNLHGSQVRDTKKIHLNAGVSLFSLHTNNTIV